MLEIDGSIGEGGGSVVRISTAICALLGKPVRIFNIRAKRPKPGLQPQHLKAIKALAEITSGEVKGAQIGSTEIHFYPGKILSGNYRIDIGTAGSTTLILQTIMPPAAFADGSITVEISGGTDNPMAPPIDFWKNVTLRILEKMGYRAKIECLRRGHYPVGGGLIKAEIEPIEILKSIVLTEPGKVERILGIAHSVKLPPNVAQRMAHAATKKLLRAGYSNIEIKKETYKPEEDPHLAPGAGITLWAETENGCILGASALGKPGKPAERVGEEAANKLAAQLSSGAGVDEHLADQLIPYMAIANGRSEISCAKLTLHTMTNIILMEKIVGVRFDIKGEMGEFARISVEGIGFKKS
ncbi:MAG: RNA 3'-terminal phosphate cyclase [Candidatus Hadarchaeales archaeon]